jgi:prepilin-type N-terminal cleavage/methylation domain-containing protein
MRAEPPRSPVPRPIRRLVRRGFTLVELMTSVVIVATLMGAMMSLLLLAGKASPAGDPNGAALASLQRARDRMADDLPFTATITAFDGKSLTITVADRTGDTTPESLTYAWSGSPGDPVTLSINGGSATPVLPRCEEAAFSLEVLKESRSVQTGTILGPVVTIAKHDVVANNTPTAMLTSIQLSQCFHPTLPLEAVSYTIASASFMGASTDPATGTLTVDIRTAQANGRPTGTILESKNVPESALGAGAMATINFTNLSTLNPKDRLCLVVRTQGATEAGLVHRATAGVNDLTSSLWAYASAAWSEQPGHSLHYEIKGQATMPVWGSQTFQRLYAIRLRARVAGVTRDFVFPTPSRAEVPGSMPTVAVGTIDSP